MNNITAIIVEDNDLMAAALTDLLQEDHLHVTLLGRARTGAEALSMIPRQDPSIVFLDIELPDMTGFELLSRLPDIRFQTIFTTSHRHYAIKAFRFNALDYLVKPVKKNELREAIKRYGKSLLNTVKVERALSNMATTSVGDQELVLATQNGPLHLALKNIVHIEGERNYSFIHLTSGAKELSSKNLAYFEDILIDKGFLRCHRSYLVNQRHVKDLRKGYFTVEGNVQIPISRRKLSVAKDWFFRRPTQ